MGPVHDRLESRRSAALDGLRGYAAAAVVFYHTILGSWPGLIEQVVRKGLPDQPTAERALLKLVLALVSGEWAVTVFFVISGIVLFRALNTMHRGEGPTAAASTAWRFLLRRALRIWPVMAVCLAVHTVSFRMLDWAWPGTVEAYSWRDLLANLTLFRSPVNGATWTLAVELAGAPVLVLAFLSVRRSGLYGLIPFFLYSALAFKAKSLLAWSPGLTIGFPALLLGVGLECGALDWAARMRAWRWVPVLGVGLVLYALLLPLSAFKSHTILLFGGITLFMAWVRRLRAGRIFDLLCAPLSQYFGRISFSLYLWNVPVFTALLELCDQDRLRASPLLWGLGVGLVTLMVTIPIADLSERWLERPCVRLGRALTGAGRGLLVTPGAPAR